MTGSANNDRAQRIAHLKKANQYRHEKAQIRLALKEGRLSLDDLLADLPPCCAKTPAFNALQWLPQVGFSTAQKLATGVISETVPVGQLGAHTRERLLERVHKLTGEQ